MKATSYFFFYTYVGLVAVAGFWGAFINPKYDHELLFNMHVEALEDSVETNLLSQYRFLRAIEFGFGVFALTFTREIFKDRKTNTLFLFIMASGILGRVAGILMDGAPSLPMQFFMYYELVGLIAIAVYAKRHLYGAA